MDIDKLDRIMAGLEISHDRRIMEVKGEMNRIRNEEFLHQYFDCLENKGAEVQN